MGKRLNNHMNKWILFDSWLKARLKEKGVSYGEFAEMIGVSRQTLWWWRTGVRKPSKLEFYGMIFCLGELEFLDSLCDNFGIEKLTTEERLRVQKNRKSP